MSDNNLGLEESSALEEEDDLAPLQMRRRWELRYKKLSLVYFRYLLFDQFDWNIEI